jgi:hypothetical protein
MLSALAAWIQELARWWYGMAGWLPGPLQVLTFALVSAAAVRLGLRHLLPGLAPKAIPPCRAALRSTVWLVLVPEFLVTTWALRGRRAIPVGVYAYGEAVAGLLGAADRGVTGVLRWLGKSRKIANQAPVWVVIMAVFLVNAVAYQKHQPLPLALWWDSLSALVSSMSS